MLFSLFAALCFGISDIFTKVASVIFKEKKMLFLNSIFSLPVALIFFLFMDGKFPSCVNFFILCLIQSLSIIAYIFFFLALIEGPVSIVASVIAGYSIVSVIGGPIFLGESLTNPQIIGVILVIFGAITISYIPQNDKIKGGKWILWTFLATFLWGIWALVIKKFENIVDPISMPLIFAILAPFIWSPFFLKDIKKMKFKKNEVKYILFVLISILLSTLGGFLFYKSAKIIYISLATPIVSSYPIFTLIGSFIFLKEKFLKHQYLSFISIMVGIILCTGNF